MSALTEFLFPAPARRSVGAIYKWWERRRLAYNVAVGSAGLFSLGVMSLISLLPGAGAGFGPPPLIGPVIFGVMANVCYLFGPITEIAIEKLWRGSVLPTGPALYRMGLTFSMGLALLPSLIWVMAWVARIVFTSF